MKYKDLQTGDWFSTIPNGEVFMKTCHPNRGIYNLTLNGSFLGECKQECADEQEIIFVPSFYAINPKDFTTDLLPKDGQLTLANAPIDYYYFCPDMDCYYLKGIFDDYEECAVSLNGSHAGYWNKAYTFGIPVYPKNYFPLIFPEKD